MIRSNVVCVPRAFILYLVCEVRISDPLLGESEICTAMISCGKFYDEAELDTWELTFRTSVLHHSGRVVESYRIQVWPTAKLATDYNPDTEDGLPWEAALDLERLIPQREAEHIQVALDRRSLRTRST